LKEFQKYQRNRLRAAFRRLWGNPESVRRSLEAGSKDFRAEPRKDKAKRNNRKSSS